MKKWMYLGIAMLLGIASCDKTPLPSPDPLKDPKLEIVVEELKTSSVKVSTKVEPGSYVITSQGVCYNTNTNPTIENQKVSGSGLVNLVNLNPGTKYYARAYATTEKNATYYSSVAEFSTTDIVVTAEISEIDYRSAKIKMKVDEELNTISERGVVYSKLNQNPSIAADTKLVGSSHDLTLLDYEATYFVRGYVVISGRTIYSATSEFTTKTLERVSDYDGNQYRIIELASKIGPRKWLLDNFKGTHYANGDLIPHVTDNNEWISLSTGAYCYYDNDKENAKTYGALYNWWAAVDPRGLIVGWHTPSDDELNELSNVWQYAVPDIRGLKLKEVGTKHWLAPNEGANNETGFTVLPGGSRDDWQGKFWDLSKKAYFLSSSEFEDCFWTRVLYYNSTALSGNGAINKRAGTSIRLIKNN